MKLNECISGLKYYSVGHYCYLFFWKFGKIIFLLTPRHLYALRNSLLRAYGAKIGNNVKIYPTVNIYCPNKLEIGDNSVIAWNVSLYNLGKIKIESNVVISQNCHLCAGTHDYSAEGFPLIKSPILIESNVWLCADVFIGPSVTVGMNSVIGARSVVIKDTPKYSLLAGNPAIIKKTLCQKT